MHAWAQSTIRTSLIVDLMGGFFYYARSSYSNTGKGMHRFVINPERQIYDSSYK